ncbi:hypothetical protein GCM10011515_02550 [Tsuneonella deserti]|uniref:DUF3604 domain-containing protein n=1 Tax=Tsuneonella deserti TaxID=2035528 RepID=A0ABQ1S0I9_9SPHN|nr:DUF3604 domain-containing protein [Tsuneonella deserti]GGD86538.1 hypothetical protein GCM10011515_02550 [Tsuneonella deserti]
MRSYWKLLGAAALLTSLSSCDMTVSTGGSSPAASGDGTGTVPVAAYPERVFWGDTHLHTDNSIDAFGFGTRLGPEEALRFARGERVTATTGIPAQLDRPLDFLVIADHSDGMGATRRLYDAPRMLIRDETLRRWHDMMHEGPRGSQRAVAELITAAANGKLPAALRDPQRQAEATEEIWQKHLRTIDRFNEPGKFTALAGFEYTLMPDGNNLHRVVVFRDGSAKTGKVRPFPGLGGEVDELWDYMDAYEKKTGGHVLAIPHNSNLSNGLMFELTMPGGGPMTAEYARRRAKHEPVVEATQIKGDSEAHKFLSPNDEFASFGVAGWEVGNLPLTRRTTPDMLGGNYVREALKRGLTIEARTGANPYRFGLVGGTDSHTGLATADENNFFGKHTGNEPSPTRAASPQNLGTDQGRFGYHYLAGGYAGVWAKANTRAEIFDALRRREVYATTGPRMTVRMFGGFDFTSQDFAGQGWVKAGYTRGVPMGGELADSGKAPVFMIEALKDPVGANLDRVQVVKGWVDASGAAREKVFDVAWSDPETRRMTGGRLPLVGNTVDRARASYTNTIGARQLRTLWRDPEYAAGQSAFYYARVIEIPTPRWVLFDALRYRIKLPPEAMKDAVAQERAYSSPIWLIPQKRPATT